MTSTAVSNVSAELQQAHAELAALEEGVSMDAAQLSYLRSEFDQNRCRILHYYEPRLLPLHATLYATAQRRAITELYIRWLECRVVQQAKSCDVGRFIERHHMKSIAEQQFLKPAQQAVWRSYERMRACPASDLEVISHYSSPPDVAIDVMDMVLALRGEREVGKRAIWEAGQVLLSRTYFTEFLPTRCEALLQQSPLLEGRLFVELELFLEDAAHAPEALASISTPLGILGEWLLAVRDYYRVLLVTCPVLCVGEAVAQMTPERVARHHALLQAWCVGEDTSDILNELSVAEAEDAGRDSQDPSASEAMAPQDAGGDEAEVNALLEVYHSMKKRLEDAQQPTSVHDQDLIVRLRHRLHALDAMCEEAVQGKATLEEEIRARIRELEGKYDFTMVPVHMRIEDKTSDFVALLHAALHHD